MKRWGTGWRLSLGALVLLALALMAWPLAAQRLQDARQLPRQQLVLLLPDAQALTHPVTQAWLQVAREEGVPLAPLMSDDFIHAMANGQSVPGVILPDLVHARASDLLVSQLYRHVQRGGLLWVNFDAAVHQPQRRTFAQGHARLSALVGVRYALYDRLREETIDVGTVQASPQAQALLGIQPGKLDIEPRTGWGELVTYGYEALVYSHFRTAALDAAAPAEAGDGLPHDPARVLMRSSDGDPVLTLRSHGRGQVLWANLPLGYLKTRTDGYLLHRLMHTVARDLLQWPVLSGVPDGVGGLVLNLHVDSNAAQAPMAQLEREGWFDDGPTSIHVTAGPDALFMHDRLGLDVPRNPSMQDLLRRLQARGHELGSHGGWIHNVFGDHVNEDNAERFAPWLALNHEAMSAVRGRPVQVYSAPMGNQPAWATQWLRERDFKAYYATADNGLGPTRAFIHGEPAPASPLWTFPISSFERVATMDDLAAQRIPEADYARFMSELMGYTREQRVARLTYFHAASAVVYRHTLQVIQDRARQLRQDGRFAWYRMQDLSEFLSRREQVQWQLLADPANGVQRLQVRSADPHPDALARMTWLIPRQTARQPEVIRGQARVQADGRDWVVTALSGQQLELQWSTP